MQIAVIYQNILALNFVRVSNTKGKAICEWEYFKIKSGR